VKVPVDVTATGRLSATVRTVASLAAQALIWVGVAHRVHLISGWSRGRRQLDCRQSIYL